MFKDFITWLYARYVVEPEFKAYLQDKFYDVPRDTKIVFESRADNDEIAVAMIEKRFAPRVDH